ncbi:uncharacterized protein [Argopecten irradians]|uniref:uncharacterized protein isoform X2 n=1 Tax=Argopecten irradians TaxID=31199 RepID=UPI00371DAA20
MGESALKSHRQSEKHLRLQRVSDQNAKFEFVGIKKEQVKESDSEEMLTVPVPPPPPSQTNPSESCVPLQSTQIFFNHDSLQAEIIWTLQTVVNHSWYRSNEHVGEVFQSMFPDSNIVKNFSCGQKKTAYMCVFGIAQYIREVYAKDISPKSFVILFDESLNHKLQLKQMDFHIRFWDTTQVKTVYYGSQFLGHGTANDMLKHMLQETSKLNLKNMVQDSPARREDFIKVTSSSLMPMKFVTHRWMENVPGCERALKVWDNVKLYIKKAEVGKEVAKPKNKSFEIIAAASKDRLIIAKLELFKHVALEVQPFLGNYQTDRPMVPFLYPDLSNMVKTLLMKAVKPEVIDTKYSSMDLTNDKNLLPHNKVEIGFAAEKALHDAKRGNDKINDRQVLEYRIQCRKCLCSLIEKLLEKSPLYYSATRQLSCLSPLQMASDPHGCTENMRKLIMSLHNKNRISDRECDACLSQFKVFLCEIPVIGKEVFENFDPYSSRLDEFLSVHLDKQQYKELFEVVKLLLILSHGQATVERGFSINKKLEVENMKEHTLVAQRLICDFVNNFGGVLKVPITKELLASARNARHRYKQYLDEEKERKSTEEQKRKRKCLEEEVENLRKKIKQNKKDHETLINSADTYALRAEKEGNLSLISHSNSLREKAKENAETEKSLDKELAAKIKNLKDC